MLMLSLNSIHSGFHSRTLFKIGVTSINKLCQLQQKSKSKSRNGKSKSSRIRKSNRQGPDRPTGTNNITNDACIPHVYHILFVMNYINQYLLTC